LARNFKVEPSFVSRIMRLMLLAPDSIEAILDGRETSGLSLEKLTKALPVNWIKQRILFGCD